MFSEKRLVVFFSSLIVIFLSINLVSALSFQELIENLWVNAALVFLFLFNIILFAVRNVFKKSYGAAVVISIVISLMCTIGLISSFGSFFSKIGLWLLLLVILAIAFLSLRFAKGKAVIIFIIFAIASLAWLAFFHSHLCPPQGTLPENACQVLDVIALIILIVLILRFLFWLLGKWGGGGQTPKPNPNPKPEPDDKGEDGTVKGTVYDQNMNPVEGANISVTKRNFAAQTVPTDQDGYYGINIPGGKNFVQAVRKYRYKLTAHKPGYSSQVRYVWVVSNRIRIINFILKGVSPPDVPVIKEFKAVPLSVANAGDKSTLHWVCENTVGVRIVNKNTVIHQQPGPNGQFDVVINGKQEEYRLFAYSKSGKSASQLVVVTINGPPVGRKKLEVYIHPDSSAGQIRIKPGIYPDVKTSRVPFQVLHESKGYTFKEWQEYHEKTGARFTKNQRQFILDMDGNCRIDAFFDGGTGTPGGGNTYIDNSTHIDNRQYDNRRYDDHRTYSYDVDNSTNIHNYHYSYTDARAVSIVGPRVNYTGGSAGNVKLVVNKPYNITIIKKDGTKVHITLVLKGQGSDSGSGGSGGGNEGKGKSGESSLILWVRSAKQLSVQTKVIRVQANTPVVIGWEAKNIESRSLRIVSRAGDGTRLSPFSRLVYSGAGLLRKATTQFIPKTRLTLLKAYAVDKNGKKIESYARVIVEGNLSQKKEKKEKEAKGEIARLEQKKKTVEQHYARMISEQEERTNAYRQGSKKWTEYVQVRGKDGKIEFDKGRMQKVRKIFVSGGRVVEKLQARKAQEISRIDQKIKKWKSD